MSSAEVRRGSGSSENSWSYESSGSNSHASLGSRILSGVKGFFSCCNTYSTCQNKSPDSLHEAEGGLVLSEEELYRSVMAEVLEELSVQGIMLDSEKLVDEVKARVERFQNTSVGGSLKEKMYLFDLVLSCVNNLEREITAAVSGDVDGLNHFCKEHLIEVKDKMDSVINRVQQKMADANEDKHGLEEMVDLHKNVNYHFKKFMEQFDAYINDPKDKGIHQPLEDTKRAIGALATSIQHTAYKSINNDRSEISKLRKFIALLEHKLHQLIDFIKSIPAKIRSACERMLKNDSQSAVNPLIRRLLDVSTEEVEPMLKGLGLEQLADIQFKLRELKSVLQQADIDHPREEWLTKLDVPTYSSRFFREIERVIVRVDIILPKIDALIEEKMKGVADEVSRLQASAAGSLPAVAAGTKSGKPHASTIILQSKKVVLPVSSPVAFVTMMSNIAQSQSQQDINNVMQMIPALSFREREELISICDNVMAQIKIGEKNRGTYPIGNTPIATTEQLLLDVRYACLLLNIIETDSLKGRDISLQQYGKEFVEVIYNRILDLSGSEIGQEEVAGLMKRLTEQQIEQLIKYMDRNVRVIGSKMRDDHTAVSNAEKRQMVIILGALRAAKPDILKMKIFASGKYIEASRILRELEDCLPTISNLSGKDQDDSRDECASLTLGQLILAVEERLQEYHLKRHSTTPEASNTVLSNLFEIIAERRNKGETSEYDSQNSTVVVGASKRSV